MQDQPVGLCLLFLILLIVLGSPKCVSGEGSQMESARTGTLLGRTAEGQGSKGVQKD